MLVRSANTFADTIGSDDNLIRCVLATIDLPDWCALERTAAWAQPAVRVAYPALRRALYEKAPTLEPTSIWDLCKTSQLTSLWARLGTNGEMAADGLQVLRDNRCGGTLLHVALASTAANQVDATRLCMWLLSRPSSAICVKARNLRGQTPLHLCAKHNNVVVARKIISLLGSDVDCRDNQDTTPLVQAVREEHISMIDVLLAAQADPNVFVPNCHGHGDTPLILAVRLKNVEVLRHILAAPGLDLHQKSMDEDCPFGNSALDFASAGPIRTMLEDEIKKNDNKVCAPRQEISNSTAHLSIAHERINSDSSAIKEKALLASTQHKASCSSEGCSAQCIPAFSLITALIQRRPQHA